MTVPVEGQAPGHLDLILTPARSLPPRGFALLMLVLAAISLVIGGFFLLQGAWPVFGFFGLDVALVYWAFRANYRAGAMRERLKLDGQTLEITRRRPDGAAQSWSFHPHWVRVELRQRPARQPVLMVASHGQKLEFGQFLPPEEKREIADLLRCALSFWR